MPITIQYDQEKKILHLTVIEKLSLNELDDALKKINSDYPSHTGILLDVSSINGPIGNTQFNQDTMEIRKRLLEREKAKIAIITPDDFTFGTSEKYEILSGSMPQNIMTFDNFIEGEEWLIGKSE